ncbi:MAG: MaoC/PaaZ C-terminal domain-containing protein [Candidatus Baldrarchaeia archaeon]|nr:MaoC/PaaZ C-terminal domain-containing protein [Candidatus Baldrarchaeota archaeon]
MALYYEDFKEGMVFESPRRTVTEADIVIFTGLSGDFNPLHTDEEFAKKTIFGRRIAQGTLTFAIMTGLWDMLGIIRGTAIAFYGVDKLRFTKPVYPGDTLRVKITVIEKKEREMGGLVVLHNEVLNQRDEVVLVCDAKILVKKRHS